MKNPIKDGTVIDWERMEILWRETFFEKLKVDPSNVKSVFLTGSLRYSRDKELMTQYMFEAFNANNMFIADHAVLALMGAGRSTGIVVDSGSSFTYSTPVYEGFILP